MSHKIRKIVSPQGWASARTHARRFFHKQRFPLEADRIIQSIDREQLEQIRQRYAVEGPSPHWPKYLHLHRWIDINIRRVRELELDVSSPKRIIDLGCGAGYFLYICRLLGHDVLGLDLGNPPMFAEITKLLGLERVISRIERFVPLPDLGQKFDLITAFLICFNRHKQTDLWGVAEWDFFLNDLEENHLNPGGMIALEFNEEPTIGFYTKEVRKYFESRSTRIFRGRVIISFDHSLSPLPLEAANIVATENA